jgi:short subunit dehydrogenase-like uncharacterized protein
VREDGSDRDLDVVLLGATGFTGGLCADYLARHAPQGLRWALAGRDRSRLAAVRERLASHDPSLSALTLLRVDVTDEASLVAVARRARVVVTTVGPYLQHGEPVVAACAAAGTDYVDLTGEPEFVDRMYLAHHEEAVRTGSRLVHCCGFDSVPHDLGALFTVERLPEGVPLRLRGMVRADAAFSGGTLASALAAVSRGAQMRRVRAERRQVEPRPQGRRIRSVERPPHRDRDTGLWLVPLPTIDPLVVRRSAGALERYGPDFGYAHYAAFRRLPVMAASVAGAGALVLAAQAGPVRRVLQGRLPQGSGPSEERRARSSFSVRFVGVGGGRTVVTEVRGGDPGYTETAKMLAESALCLAFDDNPDTSGQVTTAAAMGTRLRERLQRAGVQFLVLGDASA